MLIYTDLEPDFVLFNVFIQTSIFYSVVIGIYKFVFYLV